MSVLAGGVALVLGIAVVHPLPGQSIRGRIFLSDSTTPAVGIVISAIDASGATTARVLNTASGDYLLRLAAPGRYELRALRIGFRPTVVSGVDVGAGMVRVQNIVLGKLPVKIAGVVVRADADCSLAGRDASTFVQLWEQARGALAATHLSEQSAALDVHVVRVGGHIDPAYGFRTTDSLHAEVDSLHARESVADRVFATTPAETLAVAGYVRREPDGSTVYDVPSAESFLSDEFVARHCFSVAKPPHEHPEWIGIGFTPRKARDSVADIRGVLWLDRASVELRRLEFQYTNLTPVDFELCDPDPTLPVKADASLPFPPPKPLPVPYCTHFKDNTSNKLGLGGDADFVRLASGEWLIVRWTIRTPPDEGDMRLGAGKTRRVNGHSEKCFYGKDCYDVPPVMWPRLVTTTGTISRVTRGDSEVFRDDKAEGLIAAVAPKRAGEHPAAFDGVVTASAGHPLANAIVQTDDPGRVGMSDTAGVFHLRTLPAGPISVSVRCRGYQAVRFTVPLLADSTRHLKLALVADTGSTRESTSCSVAP